MIGLHVGIIGSRKRNERSDFDATFKAFKMLNNVEYIVSGGCPKGGDRFAEIIAKTTNTRIKIFPANWEKYGKRAGFLRNDDIARMSDVLIACVSDDRTGGTEDTIRKFKRCHPTATVYLV